MEETRPAEEQEKTAYFSSSQSENDQEANTLKLLLAINAFMFVFELTTTDKCLNARLTTAV